MKKVLLIAMMASIMGVAFGQIGSRVGITGMSGKKNQFRINAAIDDVNSNYALKATLASPAFTGTITQLTPTATTSGYVDLYTGEWTPSAASTGGTNGVYSIINPIKNVINAYGLRARVDMRDAAAAVNVNQVRGVDVCVNLNETHTYTVDGNITGVGSSIHGGASADIDGDGTVSLFYGVWGPTATANLTVPTNGYLVTAHAATDLDNGFVFSNSGAATAGLVLANHASNSPATMTNGILMESAASKMTYGINMTGAGITAAEILCQNGAIIQNIDADTLTLQETVVQVAGKLYINAAQITSDYAITDYQVPLLDYWSKTQELNRLPVFEGVDRRNMTDYMTGLEETSERLLRYIVELEARITELEN